MRSNFERRIAKELRAAGMPYKYEAYSYEYEDPIVSPKTYCAACGDSNLYQIRYYTPDFFLDNGIIIETKGKFTPRNRRTMLAVRDAYPKEDFRMLFMRDNKLNKASKTKYSDWAKANSFPYAIGSVPKFWLEEK